MKAKISRMQFFFMIPNLLYSKAIGVTAGIVVRKIGIDTWISMSFGFVIGLCLMIILTYVNSKFPEKSIIEILEELTNKWIAKFVGLVLAVYFIISYGAVTNTMLLHVKEYFLPQTPYIALCIIYTLLCVYGMFLGFECVVRFSFIGFVMSLMINLAMVFGTIKDFKLINMLPLLDKGIVLNLQSTVYVLSDISMAVLAVGILYPTLNNKNKSVFYICGGGILIGGIMVIIWPLFETGVMGADVMKKYVIVCMQQIRCAQITQSMPRYELIMASFFSFGAFVQAVAMYFCSVYCLKKVFLVKKDWKIYITLIIPLVLITFYMAKDHNKYINFLSYPWSQISTFLVFFIPIILFLLALFKGKLRRKTEK